MSNKILKKVIWPIIGNTSISQYLYYIRNKWRLKDWEHLDHMFIHIPKNAGTSICVALDVVDPGHYTYNQLLRLGLLDNKRTIYCVLRDPMTRIVSIYNYINSMQSEVGHNPFSWATKYLTLSDFIMSGLNEKIILRNYLLSPQSSYLPENDDPRLLFLDMSNISKEILKLQAALDISIELPTARKGIIQDSKISPCARDKVKKLYSRDYSLIKEKLHTAEPQLSKHP